MYSLAPEKTLRLVYGIFYLAISVTFYECVKNNHLYRLKFENSCQVATYRGVNNLKMLDAGLWMLDFKKDLFFLYPASSIWDPESFGLKQ